MVVSKNEFNDALHEINTSYAKQNAVIDALKERVAELEVKVAELSAPKARTPKKAAA